jgi:catechol 2,3-dioxygenase-like lactoylglutathione lyase family enzyme
VNLFHFNVVCSDFDRSYDFYTNAVGMRPLTSSQAGTDPGADSRRSAPSTARPGEGRPLPGDGARVAELLGFDGTGEYRGAFLYFGTSRSGAYLDLLEWQDPGPPVRRSARDIGLSRVAIRVDDLAEQLARLDRYGVPLVTAPKEFTLGVTRVRVVCFRDPDDVLLEYLEFVDRKPWGA